MELVATGAALFELRFEQVDEPLRVPQLLRRHPVELAPAKHLALAVRVGRDGDVLARSVVRTALLA
jgi:hypothetical protein